MTERDQKRTEFEQTGKRKRPLLWAAVLLSIVGIAAGILFTAGGKSASAYPEVTAEAGLVSLSTDQVGDGNAHFFTYRADEVPVNFFVLRSQDGVIRVALDTCDVCYRERKGYRQEGHFMVCNNCDQKFLSTKINEIKGGCNPAPVNRTVKEGKILIAEADLRAGARFFAPQGGR